MGGEPSEKGYEEDHGGHLKTSKAIHLFFREGFLPLCGFKYLSG